MGPPGSPPRLVVPLREFRDQDGDVVMTQAFPELVSQAMATNYSMTALTSAVRARDALSQYIESYPSLRGDLLDAALQGVMESQAAHIVEVLLLCVSVPVR